jgi:3-mercaptopyruvate sulfurtransferase SseA
VEVDTLAGAIAAHVQRAVGPGEGAAAQVLVPLGCAGWCDHERGRDERGTHEDEQRDSVALPATTYIATPDPDRLARWQYVLDRLGNPDVQILDVRPVAAYTGQDAGTYLHAGHIPGALNVDWNNNVEANPPRTFKSLAEVQASYDAIGLDRNKEIIVYCVSVWRPLRAATFSNVAAAVDACEGTELAVTLAAAFRHARRLPFV